MREDIILHFNYKQLQRFWRKFNAPNADKIALLKEMSEKQPFGYRNKFRRTGKKRSEFNRFRDEISVALGVCGVCRNQAQAQHHILKLQNDGMNVGLNIIQVCHACHTEIHPWLKERDYV